MDATVSGKCRVDACFALPGSKSIAARALLLAGLSRCPTQLSNIPACRDFEVMLEAVRGLGFNCRMDRAAGALYVQGAAGRVPACGARLSVEDSGTALRLLSAVCTLGKGRFTIDGSRRLRERPVKPLCDALNRLGAHVSCSGGGAPVVVDANGLSGGETDVDCSSSSQFLSALLVAGAFSRRGVRLLVRGLVSRPYVQVTLDLLERFGIGAGCEWGRSPGIDFFEVASAGVLEPAQIHLTIESDASSAGYFFAASALCSGGVKVEALGAGSLQADVQFVDVLARMGAQVRKGPDYIEVQGTGKLVGIEVDMSDLPDSVPVLAAIAPFASTPTLIKNVAHLRLKESDRLAALQEELARCGVAVEAGPDWLRVNPSRVRPGRVRSHGDHRIAMAMAVLGLRTGNLTIEGAECVAKSFPEFFKYMERL